MNFLRMARPKSLFFKEKAPTYSPEVRRKLFKRRSTESILRLTDVPKYSKEQIREKYSFSSDTIGDGAEGFVIGATQIATNTEVAIKLIDIERMKHSFALLETKLQASVHHAAVPLVIDLFRDSDYVYFVQERIDGVALFDSLLTHKRFDEEQVKVIAYQLLDILDYLHHLGVIHCDIKPENIMIQESTKKIYLLDFGSAKLVHRHTLTGTGASVGYSAPETITNPDSVSSKSDVWSVGVLLYTLLTGVPPFFSVPDNHEDSQMMNSAPFWMFYNSDTDNLKEEICRGNVDYSLLDSELSKAFISELLQVDSNLRLSARKARDHLWIKSHQSHPIYDRVLRATKTSANTESTLIATTVQQL